MVYLNYKFQHLLPTYLSFYVKKVCTEKTNTANKTT